LVPTAPARAGGRLVQEHVDLVGAERVGEQRRGPVQRRAEAGLLSPDSVVEDTISDAPLRLDRSPRATAAPTRYPDRVPRLRHQVDLARTPDEVFAYLSDFGNDPRWRADVLAMKPLGQPGDPEGVWSRQIEVRRVPGRTVASEAVVTASEPGKALSVRRATGLIRPEARYRFEPYAGGTRLSFELEIALAGATWLLLPAVWLFMQLAIRPVLPKDLARLKRLLEAG
jgi:hypothetical protein